jgi:hypothetical protein
LYGKHQLFSTKTQKMNANKNRPFHNDENLSNRREIISNANKFLKNLPILKSAQAKQMELYYLHA